MSGCCALDLAPPQACDVGADGLVTVDEILAAVHNALAAAARRLKVSSARGDDVSFALLRRHW